MLTILLAPSESKTEGGEGIFSLSSLIFPSLNSKREELIDIYQDITKSNDNSEIYSIFGLKKESEIQRYKNLDIKNAPVKKAIERYNGVAFDYLDYKSLDMEAKSFLEDRLLIFSNLFGVLRANDKIPDYRLKQGASLKDIKIDSFYKKDLSNLLDEYLEDREILDLRAGFYNKFYKPSQRYTTLKFLKDGKSVSHWAKAFRGKVCKEIAVNKIDSIDELIAFPLEGLTLVEIQEKKNQREIIYEVDINNEKKSI